MPRNRASKGQLVPPAATLTVSNQARSDWLTAAADGYVTPLPANKKYYSALLSLFWPEGHGIPGPHVSQESIREMMDALRLAEGKPTYLDPFRRLRELQGDEGFTSIIKEGVKYQLVSMAVTTKRPPRGKPSPTLWKAIKEKWNFSCAVCGAKEPDIKLSPDHRVPRSRNGTNDDSNWQPLCEQCNNAKSSVCAGCTLNCHTCSWAYPAEYRPIPINDANRELLRRLSEKKGLYISDLANSILQDFFNKPK
jgi:hypothetical protein